MAGRESAPGSARSDNPSRDLRLGGVNGIAIAIGPLQHLAIAVRNTLNDALRGLDVERPRSTDGDPSDMQARLLAGGHLGADVIPGLEAVHSLTTHQETPRKAVVIRQCALVLAATGGPNGQCRALPTQQHIDWTDAGRIQGVGFGNAEPRSVVFRLPTAAGVLSAACQHQ